MRHRCTFADVLIELPADWVDVGEDMTEGAPPTLAKVDGVGALQFSVARFQSGANPDVHADDLDALLRGSPERARLGSLWISSMAKQPAATSAGRASRQVKARLLTRAP